MEIFKAKIAVTVVGFYLLAIAGLVGIMGVSARSHATGHGQAQRPSSDLEKDELSLTRDIKLLRRNLHRGGSEATVARGRNFVRQDLLNIGLDRMQSAEEPQDLDRDQDLASVIGGVFAQPAQELSRDLEPASRS